MPSENVKLLILDDEALIRMSLSHVFSGLGYQVRSCADGFAGLSEIRAEVPNLILSDLNMPGMSGFEFLSVVRRRFPEIQVIAMSGAYSGNGVPPGVAADAFYEKGTNMSVLLAVVATMTNPDRSSYFQHNSALAPIWIPKNGHDPSGEAYVIITCPECLRTFPQTLNETSAAARETGCVYCFSRIHYAIVQPDAPASPEFFQRKPGAGAATSILAAEFR